jgi:hypothetical protein
MTYYAIKLPTLCKGKQIEVRVLGASGRQELKVEQEGFCAPWWSTDPTSSLLPLEGSTRFVEGRRPMGCRMVPAGGGRLTKED